MYSSTLLDEIENGVTITKTELRICIAEMLGEYQRAFDVEWNMERMRYDAGVIHTLQKIAMLVDGLEG